MLELIKYLVLVLVLICSHPATAQVNTVAKDKSKPASFYFAFGSNLSFYSKSDITFKSAASPSYNFTLMKVRAKDDQGLKFNNGGAPQYSYQLGFYNNKKNWGIEFNFDHIKYIVRQYQQVQMVGDINGKSYNTDTLITPDFISFEHTDGANYALLKWVNRIQLIGDNNQREFLSLLLKAGAGPVIPKTNSTVMGKQKDDFYKVSGYVVALEAGLKYTFSKLLFAEANVKGAYADYRRFMIADGTGSQRWFGLHVSLLLGVELGR